MSGIRCQKPEYGSQMTEVRHKGKEVENLRSSEVGRMDAGAVGTGGLEFGSGTHIRLEGLWRGKQAEAGIS